MKIVKVKGWCLEISTILGYTNDGRGVSEIKGYTEHAEVADQWLGRSAWHSVTEVDKSYCFVDCLQELNDVEKEQKREKALSKLTEEERILLGL